MPDHVEIDGVRTWYDRRGDGPPVVLLHGGLTDSRDFAGNLDALASSFSVYLPERRGHGHTPDAPGPLTIDAMSADTATFLEEVVGGPASLVGYSAGAVVALHVALRRPDLTEAVVAISGAVTPDGWLLRPTAGVEPPEPLLRAYAEVSPDGPDHFRVVVDKLARAAQERGIEVDELAGVESPALIVVGDDDIVSLDHAVALYRAIPDAALAVVANASHLLLHEHSRHLVDLVTTFLHQGHTPTFMPLARSGAGG